MDDKKKMCFGMTPEPTESDHDCTSDPIVVYLINRLYNEFQEDRIAITTKPQEDLTLVDKLEAIEKTAIFYKRKYVTDKINKRNVGKKGIRK